MTEGAVRELGALPTGPELGTLLDGLLDRGVTAVVEPRPTLPGRGVHVVATYVDDAKEIRAVVLLDLPLGTGLGAALALVPLTLAKDAPGKEILYPVATVILGGLLSSTFLDIIVTPVVFWLVGEKALAQYFAAHRETGLDDHPQELDAQPLTPSGDQNASRPVGA